MRSCAFTLVVMVSSALVALLIAPPGAVAASCRWDESDGWPAFRTYGRTAKLERSLTCPGDAAGELTITFSARTTQQRKELFVKTTEIKPRLRWDQRKRISHAVALSQYCKLDPPKAGATLITEADGKSMRAFPVELQALVRGSGALAGLDTTERVTMHCPLCSGMRSRGSLMIKKGRAGARNVEPGVRLIGKLGREWFECVRPGATLEVRYFVGSSDTENKKAIRPFYVQRGLEKALKLSGDYATLDVPVPWEKLCRSGATHLSWGGRGRGELKRVGGGGRSYLQLRCQR